MVSSEELVRFDSLPAGDLPLLGGAGDGSPIEPEVLDQLRAAYLAETISFPWQQGGSADARNMLVAHGQAHHAGERGILVGMAEPVIAEQVRIG